MADDPTSAPDDPFAMWRKQMEAGTAAWVEAARKMAGQGHAPNPPDPTQFWRQFSNFVPPGAPPFPGAGPVDPEVLALWKRFLDDWLAAWSRTFEQVMGTEAFAEALGKTLDQFLSVQAKTRETTERSTRAAIETLGLPSREQVIGLSRQMMDLEDRIEAKVARRIRGRETAWMLADLAGLGWATLKAVIDNEVIDSEPEAQQ